MNRYTYCHNNPIRYRDPSGYTPEQQFVPVRSDGARWSTFAGGYELNGVIVSTTPEWTTSSTSSSSSSSGSSGSSSSTPAGVTVTVTTSTGVQAGTVVNNVTYMADGSRPPDGAIVQFPDGRAYQMNAELGYGTPTTVVPVITPSGNITVGGLAGGYTTMLDGQRPGSGSIVVTPSGAAYMMDAVQGRGELIPDCVQVGPSGSSSKSTNDVNSDALSSLALVRSMEKDSAVDWNMIRTLNEVMKKNNISNVEIFTANGFVYRNNAFYLKSELELLGNNAQPVFRIGDTGFVIDVRTGKCYEITIYAQSGYGAATHIDFKPVSGFKEDSTFYETIGKNWSWSTLPVFVTMGDRTFAASTHGHPHTSNGGDVDKIYGHVCFHFKDTLTKNAGYQADHRRAFSEAQSAWECIERWNQYCCPSCSR